MGLNSKMVLKWVGLDILFHMRKMIFIKDGLDI